ncbi:MAG: PEP-CTERM sorting domain-containing protein [Proteobacteria bacterium]|nr:PEP-CTERM sorting domain-containing protein [Pseudomonadota bacterium]
MILNNSDLRLNRRHQGLKQDFLDQIQQNADRQISRLRALGKLKRHLATATAVTIATGILLTGQASAVTSFTETFDADNADWGNQASAPVSHDAAGFITTSGAFPDLGQGVLFRGQDEFFLPDQNGSSGGAFNGNWIADGVSQLSVDVRHNAPVPLSFFTRFSTPFNFPGATAVRFVPVMPNQWTTLSFNIAPNPPFGAPNFVTFEGSTFEDVFSNIGHVQIGASTPDGFDENPSVFTFDMDNASITVVPEPSGTLLAMAGGLLLMLRRRRSH